jgi:hypothetical protein
MWIVLVNLFEAATLRTYQIPEIYFPRAQGFAELAEGNLVHAILLKILVIVGAGTRIVRGAG